MSLNNWSVSERELRNNFSIKKQNPNIWVQNKARRAGGVFLRYLDMEDLVFFIVNASTSFSPVTLT